MIQNYSDPIVTLTQVYKASEEGTVPTLGACIIGPHYIVRKYEDFGEALRLNSRDNYPDNSDSYTYANGLSLRTWPIRSSGGQDSQIVVSDSAKVFVKNAKLCYAQFGASDSVDITYNPTEADTISIKDNGSIIDFKADGALYQVGDQVEIYIASDSISVISCRIIGFSKNSLTNKYTDCILSKELPKDYVVSSAKFFRETDCYVNDAFLTRNSSGITVISGAVSENVDLGNGQKSGFAIYGGAFYVEYRAFSKKFTKGYRQVASIDYVEDLLGKICPENPLGIAVASAVEESEGNFVYFVAIDNDSEDQDALVESYIKALDLIADKDGIYGIVPCTDNQAVAKAILQFVEKQSTEEIPYFKYLYASKDIPTQERLEPSIPLTITNIASDSEDRTVVTFAGSPLVTIGTLVAGDIFRYSTNGIIYDAEIRASDHKNKIYLTENKSVTLNSSDSHSCVLYRNLKDDPTSIIESIIAWKEISNKRCSFCIADGAMYNSTIPVKNFCVAAALAGKRSGSYPHAPLSNVAMKAITTTDEHGFTTSMSKKLGAAGFWRVGMREDGTCISRRQLTSAATGDVNYDEQSIVCNIDSIGLSLKVTGRDLVGNTNISPTLINILEAELNAKLDIYKTYVNDLIGPQLLSGSIISIKQDSVYKDRIYASLDGQPPKPFNRFHITFYMR